jgi:excisionase family DNA binding protein
MPPSGVFPIGLTTSDFARRLRIHPKTVARRCADGTLPAVRVGRVWRISDDTLRAVLTGRVNLGPRRTAA